jgi:hypothetical protein
MPPTTPGTSDDPGASLVDTHGMATATAPAGSGPHLPWPRHHK